MHRSTLVTAALLVLVSASASGCAAGGASAPAAPAVAPPATAVASAPASAPAPAEHDGQVAKQLVHDGGRLLDVRSPDEFAAGHIDGAENAPVDAIGARDLGPKDTQLVVYCGSGRRSAKAAATLRANGYTRVYDLGAMSNWPK